MRCVAKSSLFLYLNFGTAGYFFLTAAYQLTTIDHYMFLCCICRFIFLLTYVTLSLAI